jgi:leucine-rich repeat protein SHOC2
LVLVSPGNNFAQLPQIIEQLPNLQRLDLSQNPLTSLPNDLPPALPGMQYLNISHCHFNKLSRYLLLSDWRNLKQLDLSYNPLASFEPLPGEIAKVNPGAQVLLQGMPQVTRLSFVSSGITTLHTAFCQFPNLVELLISLNHITTLPSDITACSSLTVCCWLC